MLFNVPILPAENDLTHLGWKLNKTVTSTGLYRSCAALACFSGTFDLILYEAVILNLWLRRFGLVKFGLVWTNLALLWLSLVWFGLVVPQTNKQIIII